MDVSRLDQLTKCIRAKIPTAHAHYRVSVAVMQVVFTCRFSIGVLAVAAAALILPQQSREVFRRMLSEGHWCVFILAAAMWAHNSWYFARVLLLFRYPGYVELPESSRATKLHEFLRAHLPRLLGALPLVVIGLAFGASTDSDTKGWFASPDARKAAALSFLGAVAFYGIVHLRRWAFRSAYLWVAKTWFGGRRDPRLERHVPPAKTESFRALSPATQAWILTHALIFTIAVVAFTFRPVPAAQYLGSATVLLVAACTFVCGGSVLTHMANWARWPVFTTLLVLSLIFSHWNDNHALAPMDRRSSVVRPRLVDDFMQWRTPLPRGVPWAFVVTEGGGIRAAYWTAAVLSRLEDASSGQFHGRLYGISGVSGGSLGAGVFVAKIAAGEKAAGTFASASREILSMDSLAPPLAKALYPDLFQRFWPCPHVEFDRGRALEESWVQSVSEQLKSNVFGDPFEDLWASEPRRVPRLFLNATVVETGARAIVAYTQIDRSIVPDAVDVIRDLEPVRLSQGIHLSARFTYVSPAATFGSPSDRTLARPLHVVDGGYFENSGAATALDVVEELRKIDASPIYIVIRYHEELGRSPDEPGEGYQWANDALSPVRVMINTRDARGSLALAELRKISCENFDRFEFVLQRGQVPLPLGWVLSKESRDDIDGQLESKENARVRDCLLARLGLSVAPEGSACPATCKPAASEKTTESPESAQPTP